MTHAHRLFVKLARILHVYLTLFGFVLMLFFAITGFMLNHEDWFVSTKTFDVTEKGTMPLALIENKNYLGIVETLRRDFRARGETGDPDADFDTNDENVRVLVTLTFKFKSPGYLAEAKIQMKDGETTVEHHHNSLLALFLDLHRGKSTGFAWSLLIDAVSILFLIVSATGFILWTSLRARARHGAAVILLGLAAGLVVYFMYVPR